MKMTTEDYLYSLDLYQINSKENKDHLEEVDYTQQDPDLDLYSEIINEEIVAETKTNKELQYRCECLHIENVELKEQVSSLTKDKGNWLKLNSILKANISALYKTATAELNRKNSEISALRERLDGMIFRRRHNRRMDSFPHHEQFIPDTTLFTGPVDTRINSLVKENYQDNNTNNQYYHPENYRDSRNQQLYQDKYQEKHPTAINKNEWQRPVDLQIQFSKQPSAKLVQNGGSINDTTQRVNETSDSLIDCLTYSTKSLLRAPDLKRSIYYQHKMLDEPINKTCVKMNTSEGALKITKTDNNIKETPKIWLKESSMVGNSVKSDFDGNCLKKRLTTESSSRDGREMYGQRRSNKETMVHEKLTVTENEPAVCSSEILNKNLDLTIQDKPLEDKLKDDSCKIMTKEAESNELENPVKDDLIKDFDQDPVIPPIIPEKPMLRTLKTETIWIKSHIILGDQKEINKIPMTNSLLCLSNRVTLKPVVLPLTRYSKQLPETIFSKEKPDQKVCPPEEPSSKILEVPKTPGIEILGMSETHKSKGHLSNSTTTETLTSVTELEAGPNENPSEALTESIDSIIPPSPPSSLRSKYSKLLSPRKQTNKLGWKNYRRYYKKSIEKQLQMSVLKDELGDKCEERSLAGSKESIRFHHQMGLKPISAVISTENLTLTRINNENLRKLEDRSTQDKQYRLTSYQFSREKGKSSNSAETIRIPKLPDNNILNEKTESYRRSLEKLMTEKHRTLNVPGKAKECLSSNFSDKGEKQRSGIERIKYYISNPTTSLTPKNIKERLSSNSSDKKEQHQSEKYTTLDVPGKPKECLSSNSSDKGGKHRSDLDRIKYYISNPTTSLTPKNIRNHDRTCHRKESTETSRDRENMLAQKDRNINDPRNHGKEAKKRLRTFENPILLRWSKIEETKHHKTVVLIKPSEIEERRRSNNEKPQRRHSFKHSEDDVTAKNNSNMESRRKTTDLIPNHERSPLKKRCKTMNKEQKVESSAKRSQDFTSIKAQSRNETLKKDCILEDISNKNSALEKLKENKKNGLNDHSIKDAQYDLEDGEITSDEEPPTMAAKNSKRCLSYSLF